MTTAQMLSRFRFRMEDPDATKWDSGALTDIYAIFTSAQLMAIDALFDSGQLELLQEIQDEHTASLASGSFTLPTDFYKRVALKNVDGSFIELYPSPPKSITNTTDFLREDLDTAYAYIFNGKVQLQGYSSAAGNHILYYLQKPSDIDASTNPALSNKAQELTLTIAEWIAWGIDRQFDRQDAVAKRMALQFGVQPNGALSGSNNQ